MNFLKKHGIISALILLILLTLLFVIGEATFKETVTTTLETLPSQTQTAAVSEFNSNLVAHYTFDDTTNDAAGSNHGTAVGGPTYVAGKIGKALQLDGVDDSINAGSASSLDDIQLQGGGGMSISLWMKPAGGGTLITKSTGSGTWKFVLQGSGRMYFEKDGGTDDLAARAAINSYTLDAWQHVVLVWDGSLTASNVLFYVNNSLKSHDLNADSAAVASDASTSLTMGAINTLLDDVRIYNRVLTASEVEQLYTLGGGSVDPGVTNPPAPPAPPAPVVITNPKLISVIKAGTGQGTVTATGIDCGSDCSETYEAGHSVYLTATPASGSAFTGWGAGSCYSVGSDGVCRVVLAPAGNGANVTALFGLAAAESGTTVAAVTCEASDVQSAINKAGDGYVVLVPEGTCTWTTSVGINNKSIILKGAGIDKTTIIENLSASGHGLSVSVQLGKPVRVTGFTFEGSRTRDNYASVSVSGPPGQPSFRVDNNKFNNVTERGVIANGVYGLIDHNIFIRKPDGSSPTLISVFGGNYDDSWLRPQDMGTSNAVFMEDNIFVHSVKSNGVFDMYRGARYVFRNNNSYGAHLGHHGFDSDLRGEVNFEIYNNCIVNAAPRDQSPFVLHSYSDCSINPLPATTPFAHDTVLEIRSGSGVVFDNTVTRVPTGNNGGYFDSFLELKNYRSSDGYITNYGYPIPWDGKRPSNGVCNGTNSLDGNLPGMYGYPCKDQIGRTSGFGPDGKQTLSPVYSWNNNFQGNIGGNIRVAGYATYQCPKTNSVLVSKNENPAQGEPISWVCKDTTTGIDHTLYDYSRLHIIEGRDFFSGVPRPGYTPYTYPHPLQISGFTSDAGGPVITVPIGNPAPPVTPPILPPIVPPPTTPLLGDFNSDGKVNSLDFSALSSKWNQSSAVHDLNKDGTVNSLDFSLMAQNWTG